MLTSFGQNVPIFFLGRSLSLPGTRALFHQKPLFGGVKDSFFLILFFPLVPNQGKESQ